MFLRKNQIKIRFKLALLTLGGLTVPLKEKEERLSSAQLCIQMLRSLLQLGENSYRLHWYTNSGILKHIDPVRVMLALTSCSDYYCNLGFRQYITSIVCIIYVEIHFIFIVAYGTDDYYYSLNELSAERLPIVT